VAGAPGPDLPGAAPDRVPDRLRLPRPDGQQIPLERDEVIRLPNPLDPYRGVGPAQSILADLAVADFRRLVRAVKRGLKKIQYRPHLVNGYLAETGLTLMHSVTMPSDITN
jgi:hypothetical protein